MDLSSPLVAFGYLALTLVLLLVAIGFEARAQDTEDPTRLLRGLSGSCIAMLVLGWASVAYALHGDSVVISASAWTFTVLWCLLAGSSIIEIFRTYRRRVGRSSIRTDASVPEHAYEAFLRRMEEDLGAREAFFQRLRERQSAIDPMNGVPDAVIRKVDDDARNLNDDARKVFGDVRRLAGDVRVNGASNGTSVGGADDTDRVDVPGQTGHGPTRSSS